MRHARPGSDLPDVFRGSHAVAEGLLKASHLRGPHVVRLFRDVYRPAWVPLTAELAARGAVLVMPETARLTGRSLAALHGVRLLRPSDPVEVVVPERHAFTLAGLDVRRTRSDDLGAHRVRGLAVADGLRMGFDLASRHPLPLATAHLDAVVTAGLLDHAAFTAWLWSRRDDHVRHVRRACQLVAPGAESLPESQVRVVLSLAGIHLVVQHVVRFDGRFVARVDLADLVRRVAIEYDGAHHGLASQLGPDRDRLNRLAAAGWTVVHLTAQHLRDPHRLVAEVRAGLARAAPLAAP